MAAALFCSSSATAGIYTDDLSRCLVESSTASDKIALVKWMFAVLSLHPAVKSMASIPAEELENANKETAGVFVKLLAETCKDQTIKAVKYEGGAAIQASFNVLGQVAAKELLSHSDVASGMSGLVKYIDEEKLKKALGDAPLK